MTNCTFCEIIEKKYNLLYEDEKVFAMLHPNPASAGHIILLPKEHHPILEQVPDYVVSELFSKANKLSIAVFEAFGAHGTNLIIQNGIAAGQKHSHVMLHIIPRFQNDGLNLLWQPKQLSEEQMSTAEIALKESTKGVGEFEKEKAKPIEQKEPEKLSQEKEDYLLKQLKRMP